MSLHRRAARGWLCAGVGLAFAPAALATPDAAGELAARQPQSPSSEQRPSAVPAPVAPIITPPRLLTDALVEYPAGASGDAEVLLELVVAATGEVREARVVTGVEPFAAAAAAAALRWRFEPALRGEQAVAARLRFQVLFAEPAPTPAPEVAPAEPPASAGAAPAPPPIEVTVTGQRPPAHAQSFTRAEVRQLPGAFGDPFRAIESLPGVTPILSGVPFFYVRGAPPGNVGYFLDGIRLPLLYHVGLGPSVVHPALVSRVDLYPGAYPTRYGRFSGGIVAGEVNEPGERAWGEWQLRLFDMGALAEAPFAGGRGHVLLGGRYSYTAYLLSLLSEEDVRLEYWDYQLRASYRLAADHTLGVFVFGSFDYFGEDTAATDDQLFSTEFHRIDLRYRYRPRSDEELMIALTLGADRTRVAEDTGSALNRRAQLRAAYQRALSPALELRAGFDAAIDYYTIEAQLDDDVVEAEPVLDPSADPRLPQPTTASEDDEQERRFRLLFPSRLDHVAGAFGELSWQALRGVRVTSGLRSDVYASAGALALSLEPRLSAELEITERLTLKHALGLAAQPPSFVVPVAGFEIGGLPGGLQRSVQSSAGLEYRLPDGMKLSLTLFQNAFFNMTDVLSLARLENEDELEPDTRTRGQAYGLELLFHRDLTRRLGGFLAYTLSRSVRSSSLGRVPASFDRTHVLNTALGYDLGRNWRVGGHFMYYTGNPSFASSLGLDAQSPGGRLPAYHRLDLRIEKRWPFGSSGGFAAVVLEWLNTTLSKEVVSRECDGNSCEDEAIGPVTIPSLAFEGRF